MKKKAQGISLNVVIIAAIALLVLVILAVVLVGRMNIFNIGVSNCENKGGSCVDADSDCTGTVQTGSDFACKDTSKVCCIMGTPTS